MANREPQIGRTVALAILLSVFWLLLSGRIGVQYFIFMVLTLGLVMWMNPERPFRSRAQGGAESFSELMRATRGLVRYLGWLVWNVFKANIDVAIRILSPSMPIEPKLLVFRTELENEVAQALVANSITLTPGTVTIDLKDGEYLVHALHPETATAVTTGELQNLVGPIFGEGPEPPPELLWGDSMDELRQSELAAEYREGHRKRDEARLRDGESRT